MKRDVLLVLPGQAGGALQMACRALIAAQQAAHEPSTLPRPLSLSQMCHLLAQLGQKAASTANASRAEANTAPAVWVNGWRGSAANISGLVFTPETGKILPVLVHYIAAPGKTLLLPAYRGRGASHGVTVARWRAGTLRCGQVSSTVALWCLQPVLAAQGWINQRCCLQADRAWNRYVQAK